MAITQPSDSALPANVVAPVADLAKLRFAARELTLTPKGPVKSALSGTRSSRFRGRGMDFDEVRPYQAGDDIRSIDWRVTARTTVTHTKIFREERERPLLLVCDLRQSMLFGSQRLKSVVVCEIAALLGWAGLNSGDRVGALVFGSQQQRDIRTRHSQHSVLQLIHALHETSINLAQSAAKEKQAERYTLTEILEDTRRVAHPGANIIVISDFKDLDSDGERHLYELGRHCSLSLCHIYDTLERHLPPPGQYQVSQGARRFTLNTASKQLRERFEQQYHQQEQALRQTATRFKIPLLSFSTDEAVIDKLRQTFGKRPRRKHL